MLSLLLRCLVYHIEYLSVSKRESRFIWNSTHLLVWSARSCRGQVKEALRCQSSPPDAASTHSPQNPPTRRFVPVLHGCNIVPAAHVHPSYAKSGSIPSPRAARARTAGVVHNTSAPGTCPHHRPLRAAACGRSRHKVVDTASRCVLRGGRRGLRHWPRE